MNKVVLITGASRGIGRDIAEKLAQKGYQVIANYNRSEEKAKELKSKYANIDIYKADVSKREEVHNMIKSILEKYKKIDVLINNAGISLTGLFTDVTDEEWNKIINNDLYSVFCTTQEVLTNMIMRKEGCIINIMRHCHSGLTGTTIGQVYRLIKQLQGTIGRCNGCQQDGRFQKRYGDLEECLHRACTIDFCCFIYRIFNILKSCQIEYHVISGPSPDQRKDNYNLGTGGISQEIIAGR